jgi:hypothetical protein
MQTTYRLKAQEIGTTFLKSVKMLFAGQEIEIVVKSVESEEKEHSKGENRLLEMIKENRQKAPVITHDIDIRNIIDDSQYPGQ